MLDLREKLGKGLLIGDGAVGTLLADRGFARPSYSASHIFCPTSRAT